MMVAAPPSVNDNTEIDEACAYLAHKLRRIQDIATKTEKLAELLISKYVCDIGVLRAKTFTVLQIEEILIEAGLDEGARPTVEVAWGIKFNNPPGCAKRWKHGDREQLQPSTASEFSRGW
jgi:hypothetical protein